MVQSDLKMDTRRESNDNFKKTYSVNSFDFAKWSAPTETLKAGEGAFLFNPTDAPLIAGGFGGFKVIVNDGVDPYKWLLYPRGSKYNAMSYSIGTAYISAKAQNPDACYRWLTYLAQHIDVFGAMPVRLSQISDPAMASTLGENAAFYQQYADLLKDPNTIVFPSAGGGNANISDFIIQFWLNRAFDNYVLNNADLTAELNDAQTYATAFQQCVAALPPASILPSDRFTDVQVVPGDTSDSLRFAFGDSSLPGPASPPMGTLAIAKPPYTNAGSGAPISIDGDHVLQLTFTGMSLQNDVGQPTYDGPADIKQNLPALREAVLYDASEGVIGWYIGYDGDGCVSLIDDGRGLLLSRMVTHADYGLP